MESTEADRDDWCFAWFGAGAASDRLTKAALLKAGKWQPGDKISVSFLDGDAKLQQRVISFANTWTGANMANVRFVFQDNNNSLVRISLKKKGSWSLIGTTCRKNKDQSHPTMNLGGLEPGSPDERVRRAALHEFGHVLGLVHEHQSPESPIEWNRDAVIHDIMSSDAGATPEYIEENLFQAYARKDTNFTVFDRDSIMLYRIPAAWTMNGSSAPWNTQLSKTDRAFIRKQYP